MKNLLIALGLSVCSFTAQSAVVKADIVENFANGDFLDVPNQNQGQYEVRDINGGILHLNTDAWTYISTADLFGFDTLDLDKREFSLNFEMRIKQGNNNPGQPSEIGGVLLANENVMNIGGNESAFSFNLSGTQNFGSKDYRYNFDDLTNGKPTWQTFTIDLSEALDGQYEYLVFINDCDDDNCENLTQFRNISVEVPEPSSLAILTLSMAGLVQLRRKK